MSRSRFIVTSKGILLSLAGLFFFLIGVSSASLALAAADVALYDDTTYPDGGAWPEGLEAIKTMLAAYGYTYETIGPTEINANRNLASLYKALIVGGGWAGGYNQYVSNAGYRNIRDFVSQGRGFFGICAGSYFASDTVIWQPDEATPAQRYNYPLNLFGGRSKGAVLDIISWTEPTGCKTGIIAGAAITTVQVNNDLVPDVPAQMRILYYGGPLFLPRSRGADQIQVVATYSLPGSEADGSPAMILFPYGQGKVFLTGPHPEISFENCVLDYNNQTCTDSWRLMDAMLSLLVGKQP